MAGKQSSTNPLVVTGKGPDTTLNVQLHPLVLLTISDYITRHTLRQQSGAIVGAVIGQQNGRDITLEHAFECRLADGAGDGSTTALDGEWFTERLSMFKEVHKVPALDLVAIFQLGPAAGPQPEHLPVMRQVQGLTGLDGTLMLLFHPETVDSLQGGKLPISLWETVEELEDGALQTRFREVAFEVETGDAEMIGVDFVAKGAANATAVPKADANATASNASKEKKGKGKGKSKDGEEGEGSGAATAIASTTSVLSAEDDELISSLNAKVNAIKMLDERLNLLRKYLESLPRSYLTEPASDDVSVVSAPAGPDTNFTLLRSMNALLSRLPLLAPPTPDIPSLETSARSGGTTAPQPSSLALAGESVKQDVHLTALLASLTRSVAEAQTLGNKFGILQRERQSKDRSSMRNLGRMGGGGMGGGGGGDDGIMGEMGGY